MKKSIKLFSVFSIFLLCFCCSASMEVFALGTDNVLNNNNILITGTEYQNLLNLGFTENEILNMTLDEYEMNKNLRGTIVAQNVIYFDEQNNILNNKNNISTFGLQPGYIETTAKK